MEQLIRDLLHITDDGLCKQFAALGQLEHLRKGETFLEIGGYQTKLYILVEGVLRFYYQDQDQKEYTMCFICEPGYPAMVDSYSKSILTGAHAVTDATLLSFPMAEGLAFVGQSPALTAVYINILRRCILFHAETAMVLRGCTALQRYQWFLKTFPGVDHVANSRHIASFLNIAPETLSRLRAQTRESPQDFCRMYNPISEKNCDAVREELEQDPPFKTLN